MSHELKLSELEFGSLFTYTPKAQSDSQRKAKDVTFDIKYYRYVEDRGRPVIISEYISNYIKKEMGNLPFRNFFDNNPILVPVPNSSKRLEDTLWVPHKLATALHENGFGISVSTMLQRKIALRKAATSPAKDRPKALEHFRSLEVQDILSEPKRILLIDDVVTRGATLLGAANKLFEIYPWAEIRAFTAMRTMSDPNDFKELLDPCTGHIYLNGEETQRIP
jgi:hypothetical protein